MSLKNTLIGIMGIAYLTGVGNVTIDINKKIEPLRQEFRETVENSPAKVIKEQTIDDSEIRILNYGGKLDSLVEKRKEYLNKKGCIAIDWSATDNKIPGGCYVVCLNPFIKLEKYKE